MPVCNQEADSSSPQECSATSFSIEAHARRIVMKMYRERKESWVFKGADPPPTPPPEKLMSWEGWKMNEWMEWNSPCGNSEHTAGVEKHKEDGTPSGSGTLLNCRLQLACGSVVAYEAWKSVKLSPASKTPMTLDHDSLTGRVTWWVMSPRPAISLWLFLCVCLFNVRVSFF